MTDRDVRRSVRAELAQDHRYRHTIRVARLAETLARAHGEECARARLAGMLHDLARLYSADELLQACAARSMPVDDFERAHPVVLHARLGAELAKERYGVTDEGVLDAIRTHTLASPAMGRLAEILYLADSLEPGRDFPLRETYLSIAKRDLHEAMRTVLASSADYLTRRGLTVAPQTAAAIERYNQSAKESTLCRT